MVYNLRAVLNKGAEYLRPIILAAGFLLPGSVMAAGPTKVATIDRTIWPFTINDQQAFNHASAAEIRAFAAVLDATVLTTQTDIQHLTGLKTVNVASVAKWTENTRQRLLSNYRLACPACQAHSWQDLVHAGQHYERAGKYRRWRQESRKFYQRYVYELVRLAALFPRISSEIELFDKQQEENGFALPDGQFLLSYDDGPAATVTHKGKSFNRTQSLIRALNFAHLHAQFFVLGTSLANNKPQPSLYRHQCVGSHGAQHKSHQQWTRWQQSVSSMRLKLQPYQAGAHWFRPPYGQRTPELIGELKKHGEKVMLWNIDSQDWNRKLKNRQVEDRVKTLMLLWRHGIILYHDIHERAEDNLPGLVDFAHKSGVVFIDCRQLAL